MTFDELSEKSVAVMASDIFYNYFSKTLEITITPEYGYKDDVEGKIFKIKFNNCVYLNCATSSKMASGGRVEFTSWGKHKAELCGDDSCLILMEEYLSETPGAGFEKSFLRESISKKIEHYFFENIMGDAIDLLAEKVVVEEIV